MPTHHLTRKADYVAPKEDICLFGQTNFRNQMRKFGIKTDDRRRHMYVIGKTGMGKTTLMENMVLHDIYAGNGVGVVDPHGDFAEKVINYIPNHRINDVVYFNPADLNNPIGFNILEVHSEEQKHLIAAGLMGVFKKIWPDVWSSRMEYILNNVLLALLDSQGSTLLGINRMLADKKYRKRVVGQIKDPVVKKFWVDEYASWTERYAVEAGAAVQNKIGQFLSASVIRNMVAQVKSTIDIRGIMDSEKIFIMNLSKGRIGEDNSRLLGGMLITKIQLSAMERVDTLEADRKDFFLYVDEFQNFANPSFANILSEARKYRLSLIMAHQYIAQLDEVVADAVFGNVGTMVTFRVGGADADVLVKEFTPTFMEEDIVNLPKFTILLKLMIDGVASQPFSSSTLPPIGSPTGSEEKVIKVSRERYAKRREDIEEKIMRWSGMAGPNTASSEDDDEDEDEDTPPPKTEKSKKERKPEENKAKADKPKAQKEEPNTPTPPSQEETPKTKTPPPAEREAPKEPQSESEENQPEVDQPEAGEEKSIKEATPEKADPEPPTQPEESTPAEEIPETVSLSALPSRQDKEKKKNREKPTEEKKEEHKPKQEKQQTDKKEPSKPNTNDKKSQSGDKKRRRRRRRKPKNNNNNTKPPQSSNSNTSAQ